MARNSVVRNDRSNVVAGGGVQVNPKNWKLNPDVFIFTALAIMLLFSGFAVWTAKDAAHTVDRKLCEAAQPSWRVRQQLIIDTNEHSVLAPGIDPNSTEGRTLQLQIDIVNKRRDDRKAHDLALNGAEPCVDG